MKTNSYHSTRVYALTGMLIFIFSIPAFAQTHISGTVQHSAAEEHLSIAKATVKAYEEGDWDEMRSFLAEDARIYGVGNTDSMDVDQTLTYWSRGRDDANPNLSEKETWLPVSIEEGPREGNWVFYWGRNTLTYKNGEDISFPFHVSMKMEDDRISEAHFYYDNMKIIRALGYAISPPLEEEQEETDPEERF